MHICLLFAIASCIVGMVLMLRCKSRSRYTWRQEDLDAQASHIVQHLETQFMKHIELLMKAVVKVTTTVIKPHP